MTPFEWTRGRLLATVASFARKASRPSLEMAGTGFGYRGDDSPLGLLRFSKRPQKAFSWFGNIL